MKAVTKFMFSAAAFLAAGTMAVQAQTLNKAADWQKSRTISDGDGVLLVNGKNMMRTGKRFDIDPTKRYTFTYSVCAPAGKPTWVLGGFIVYDKRGRQLRSINCQAVAKTQTVVVADAKKGDKTLTLKDASAYKKSSYVLFGGAKADFSDLPNYNVLARQVQAVAKKGNVWEVTFKTPLTKDVKAGTSVRLQADGGYIYTAGMRYIRKNWVTMSGSIKGIKPGTWQGNYWPAGAAKAELLILADWAGKGNKLQFKNISLTVK